MNKELFLSYFKHYSQFRTQIVHELQLHPEWVNDTFQKASIIEFLIDYNEEDVLIKCLPFIKEVPLSIHHESLVFYILKKKLFIFLDQLIEYFPNIINTQDNKKTYVLEYLIDSKQSFLIQKYVNQLDFSSTSSNDYSLLHYLIYSDIPETLDFVLRNRHDLLNESFNYSKPILECLIEERHFEIIQELSHSFNFTLPSSQRINLFSYLVNAKLPRTLLAIVRSCPELLIQQGCDGIYPAEYLIDKRCFLVLKEFYHLIDFQVSSSHGDSLLFYLIHADMPEILEKILYEHPHFLLLEDSKQCSALHYLKKYEEERLVTLFENQIKINPQLLKHLNEYEYKFESLKAKDKLKFYIEHIL